MTIFKQLAAGWLCVWFALTAEAAEPIIDRSLAEVHNEAGVSPAPICDDATFLRRLTLDLVGRVPSVGELNRFLADPDRTAAVDRLLDDAAHPQFWSRMWLSTLVGRAPRDRVETELLRRWLEEQIATHVPLDQWVFHLIAAQGVTSLHGPANFIVANRDDPVMRLSRTFLSVQLDCAECHDHPYDRWTNDDYLAMKRFFEPLTLREVSGGISVTDVGRERRDPLPVFLTGRKPQTAAWRRELALMVVQSKPFSRAMVNRTWYWLMGRGLVDPVDGWTRENQGTAPQLLEELAASLRDDGFELRRLIRRICLSDAYQRQPATAEHGDAASLQSVFAARTVRPLMPEQWLVSVAQVLDRPLPSSAEITHQTRQLLGLTRASRVENDPFEWSSSTQSLIRQLSSDIPSPLRDLDEIYLATLSRRPTIEEAELAKQHPSQSILFALVNCNEFVMND